MADDIAHRTTLNSVEENENWAGFEVITEIGEILGWVKNVSCEDDSPSALVISILPILWLPKVITGSYRLPASEIVSFGPDRVIVLEGAKYRLDAQTVSWLERIGLIHPPWCQAYEEVYSACNGDDEWREGDDPGASLIPVPRKPGPTPLSSEVEVPKD
ncbi:hypothetical protein [Acaryochloris sp. IP29b_bin.137]|uniref:hypothetical protein n=1 Tax=Acaryochloris sp. IP29b_bin.137 TaxID=2969217 RepID=UPI002633E93B|nr:hypothetical protein [Acaryochloris sp. IP29b_bin.137]